MSHLNKLSVVFILFLIAGCYKDNIRKVTDSVHMSPDYSLPIGDISFDINDQLELLDIPSTDPAYDSIAYNDTIYPLYQSEFYVTETVEFNSNMLGAELTRINSLLLRLVIENSFPTEVRFRLFFVDENLVPVPGQDNLETYTIEPARIDGDGMVIAPTTVIIDIPFSEELINNIDLIHQIGFNCEVDSKNPEEIITRFYPEYHLNIHIGVRIGLEYDTSLL